MAELRTGGRAIWMVAAMMCAYMTWMAWRGPPPRPLWPTPNPIQRGVSDSDIEAVTRIAVSMTMDLNERFPSEPVSNLEDLLSDPIPDNPLVEGVGTHAISCETDPKHLSVDWLYCPDSRTVRATVPAQ